MKKHSFLIVLLSLLVSNVYAQRIFWTEQAQGTLKYGTLTPTGITSVTGRLSSLSSPSYMDIDPFNGTVYWIEGYTELKAAGMISGTPILVKETFVFDEIYDISYTENLGGGVFVCNSGDVQGLRFVPFDNNNGSNDYNLDVDPYNNSTFTSVENDDGSNTIFGALNGDAEVVMGEEGAGFFQFGAMSSPGQMSYDRDNSRLYISNSTGATSDIYRYDFSTLTNIRAGLSGEIVDLQVYPGMGKIYYSIAGQGIYSIPITGIGTPTLELSLPMAGNVYFALEIDYTPPVFTVLSPLDNATGVTPSASLQMTFSEDIQKSTTAGTVNETGIRLMRTSDNSQVDILDRSSAAVTVTGNTVTFDFPGAFDTSESYYILIGNKVFSDLSSNNFIGIVNTTGWNFTTGAGVTSNMPTGIACVGTNKSYPTIVLTETEGGNFNSGPGSLVIAFSSAGYFFENTTGSISASGGNLTITSSSITNANITINYNVSGQGSIDAITISGIKMRAASEANPPTTIIRTGGTGIIDGLPVNTVIANVNAVAQPPPPDFVFNNTNSICLNGDPSTLTVTTTGTDVRWLNEDNLLLASFITGLNGQATVSAQDLSVSTATAGTVTKYLRQNVGGCISLSAVLDFNINPLPQAITTDKTDQTSCSAPNGSASVTDVDGSGTAGYDFQWLDEDLNPLGPTAPSISNVAAGTYNVRVTNTLTGCSALAPAIAIADNAVLPTASLAANPNSNCEVPNGTITATVTNQTGPLTDYGFAWYNGPTTASPPNGTSTSNVLSNLAAGTYTVTVTHLPTQCTVDATTSVSESFVFPTTFDPSGVVCETVPGSGMATVDLTVYDATITGGNADLQVTWRDGSNNPIITPFAVTNTQSVAYDVKSITSGCAVPRSLVFTVTSAPTAANAGPDQNVCGTTTTLAGNAPASGAGTWTIVSGAGGSIANANSPTSTFTGANGVTYTLRWTIANLPCSPSSDDVQITVSSAPTVANAGVDKNICGSSVAMTANAAATGSGKWTVVSGGSGSFANDVSPTTTFSGTPGASYTLRWTITNGGCPPSSDDVAVSLVAAPTVANAGANLNVCALSTNLAGNTPGTGVGAWSIINGAGGAIATSSNPTSSFTGVPDVTYTLRWTISNGICPPSTDDVTVLLTEPITVADAGDDQSLCTTSTSLNGNPAASGTGTWSIVAGTGGTITTPTNPLSNFTGVGGRSYTLRWTISKPGCTPSSDEMSIELKTLPTGSGTISPQANLCVGESATLTVSGITNVETYQWQVPGGVGFNPSTGPSIEVTAQSGTGGTLTAIPQNECGNAPEVTTTISVLALPSLSINFPETVFSGEPATFSFTSDQVLTTFEWSLGDGTITSSEVVEHSYEAPGDYPIQLAATASNGCENSVSGIFTVSNEPDLNDKAIKNVITANGDDKNRVLFIENLHRYPENEVRFLDRWGVEIFSSKNYQNDWEARAKDGQYLPAGQYMCIVKLNSSGKVISRTVSIIKGR